MASRRDAGALPEGGERTMNMESWSGRTSRRFGWACSDEGVSAVIVAIVMVVLIGFAALVVDLGSLYRERRSLQTAADAAALAGVQELPTSTSAAADKARKYVALNAPEATNVSVTFPAGDTVKVVISAPKVGLFFARIWGMTTSQVGAKAAARITSPTSYSKGVIPVGVIPLGGDESASTGYGYSWGGPEFTIKQGGGSGTTGNYGWLQLEGNGGTSVLRAVFAKGGGAASLGQMINTDTGNRTAALQGAKDWIGADLHSFADVCPAPDANGVVHINHLPSDPAEGCHRLMIVPIVINPNGSGSGRYSWPSGKKTMQVIGFAQFFITYAGGTGNGAEIRGKFVRTVSEEEAQAGAVGSSGQVHYGLVQ